MNNSKLHKNHEHTHGYISDSAVFQIQKTRHIRRW